MLPTKAITLLARSKVKVSTSGPTALHTKVNGLTTRLRVLVYIFGKMVESVMASGLKMICLDMASIYTLMESDMMVSIYLTKKRDSVFTSGLMEECMKVGGTKESSMALVHTTIPQKTQSEKGFGKTANV